VCLLYRVQQCLYQFTIPPCLAAMLILPEVDGSRNLFDPREKLAQDKCCLPWLVSHENQSSQIPLGVKTKKSYISRIYAPPHLIIFFFFPLKGVNMSDSIQAVIVREERKQQKKEAKPRCDIKPLSLIYYLRMPNQTATLESMFQPL